MIAEHGDLDEGAFAQNKSADLMVAESSAIAIVVVFTIVIVHGIVLNFVALMTILCSKNLMSIFDMIVFNICGAGILGALFSPLHLYRRLWGLYNFALPTFMCKIAHGTELTIPFVESINVCSFTVLRFVSLAMPDVYVNIRAVHAKVFIGVSWLVALLFSLPGYTFFGVDEKQVPGQLHSNWSCSIKAERVHQSFPYAQFVHHLFFYIPVSVTLVVSMATGYIIYSQRRRRALLGLRPRSSTAHAKQNQKENYILIQLGLVCVVFAFSYIPISIYHMYKLDAYDPTVHTALFDWWYNMAVYICMRVCESLFPVMFFFTSEKMRSEAKRVWTCDRSKQTIPITSSVRRTKTFTTELPLVYIDAGPSSPTSTAQGETAETSTWFVPAEDIIQECEVETYDNFCHDPTERTFRTHRHGKRFLVRNSNVENLMREFVCREGYSQVVIPQESEC